MKFIKQIENVIDNEKFKFKLKTIDTEFEEFINFNLKLNEDSNQRFIDTNEIQDVVVKTFLDFIVDNIYSLNDYKNIIQIIKRHISPENINSFSKRDLIKLLIEIRSQPNQEMLNKITLKFLYKTKDFRYLQYLNCGNEGFVYKISPNLVCKLMSEKDVELSFLKEIIKNPIPGVVIIKDFLQLKNKYLILMEKCNEIDSKTASLIPDVEYDTEEILINLNIDKPDVDGRFEYLFTSVKYNEHLEELKQEVVKNFASVFQKVFNRLVFIFKNLGDRNFYNSDMHNENFMFDMNNELVLIDIISRYTIKI